MSQRLPLLGGSYVARSIIASAQRCINVFPEENPKDALTQVTHYQRPGFRPLVQGPQFPVRCLYRSSQGQGYCVLGQGVYAVSSSWVLTQVGTLIVPLDTPVSMTDNGVTLVIGDSSPIGYEIVLATGAFSQIADSTGTFTGATRLDMIDGYMVWNIPGTPTFGSTYNNEIVFDPLYTAAKNDFPDPLISLLVCRRELFLLGALKSEIWFDAGNTGFPFAELPGASFDHGLCAPYSLCSQGSNVIWLSQDLQGQGVVLLAIGYQVERVSNHALEFAIQQYSTISDAIGYVYQQGGHSFYVLSFPTGNATWVLDLTTRQWHQRCWTDAQGNLNRDRSNCCANLYGTIVVGDWQNGTLYALDPASPSSVYTDTVNGTTGPISFIRGFPHIGMAIAANGMPIPADGKKQLFSMFQADMETGLSPLDSEGNTAQVGLRMSLDRGRTFGNINLQPLGTPGQYLTYPSWRNLGISRDAVFELSWNSAGPAALNGGWVSNVTLNN